LDRCSDHPTVWLTDPDNRANRIKVSARGIKVQTIYSAKGLQFRAVVVIWSDSVPWKFKDLDEASERRLLYVALTRAEDFLAVSCSGGSRFLDELASSGKITQPR
jgi:ATP-dependent exoDNAse (exonuclease V) beta subunit